MNLISKDQLFSALKDSFPAELVPIVDSNGNEIGAIKMRGLSTAELVKYQDSLTVTLSSGQRRTNTRQMMSKLIALCAINEDGSPYFTPADVLQLEQLPARTMLKLFESAQRLCGLTDDDFKEMSEDFDRNLNGHSSSD